MKYTGGCHCKQVSYEVDLTLDNVLICNCSHCQIKGMLFTFVSSDTFTLLQGSDSLANYHFNKKAIDHLFCKNCGVESFARGRDNEGQGTVAINVRCLDGINLDELKLTPVDGKSW